MHRAAVLLGLPGAIRHIGQDADDPGEVRPYFLPEVLWRSALMPNLQKPGVRHDGQKLCPAERNWEEERGVTCALAQ